MVIHLALADLSLLTVDAIVNPTNSRGAAQGGIVGHIAEMAGPAPGLEFLEEAPVAVGAALVTGPGELFCKAIIHAPLIEEPGKRVGVENVRKAARAAMLAAAHNQFESIAFPPLGSGPNGVPFDETTRAMVDEFKAQSKTGGPQTIWLIAPNPNVLEQLEDSFQIIFGG